MTRVATALVLLAGCHPDGGTRVVADFEVAAGVETHPCFVVESSFGAGEQVTGWRPIVESPVIHHWLLYRTVTPMESGVHEECRIPADAQLLFAWSPGGDAVELPDGVGLEMGEQLVLAVHYLNSTGATVRDRSGVELFRAETPRADVAGVFVLGTSLIEIPARSSGHEIATSCVHRGEAPLHALASSPHMHGLGRALRAEIEREGERSTLFALEDFDAGAQVTHMLEPEVIIEPGDRLHTTCVYDNPGAEAVRYGIDLDDEMCLDYLLAYPVSALTRDRNCY